MELEQPMFRETTEAPKLKPANDSKTSIRDRNSSSGSTSSFHVSSELCHGSKSFRTVEKGEPKVDSAEKNLSWLRSQIIGGDAEFDSPFGTRKLTYADHTASGRCLHYIENFIVTNVLPFYGTTAAIKRLQEVMGISVPSFLRDRVINCLTNEKRWLVFIGRYERHSNLLSWRQSLAEVVEIGLDENDFIDIEALRQQLELYKYANMPLLGSFSACSNVTGIQSDTREIAKLLHGYGGFVCFDFAASGPYVEIDMRSGETDEYDAIFLSPHKFLGGPGSPGFLLMNKALYQLGSSPPSTCGSGTVNYVNGFNEKEIQAPRARDNPCCLSSSTPHPTLLLAPNKEARGGCACVGPYGHSLLDIDQTRTLAFREATKKGYVGAKPEWTRVSFPYYMSNEEFEYILVALEFVAIYAQRFLPLYHFNLRTGNWTFKKKALKDLVGKENSHSIHVLPLARAFQAISMDHDRIDTEKNDASIILKYASYLKSAERNAAPLPKFPSQRRFHEYLPFRV
ncbi:hypothetical protein CRYUN_Cryun17cG0073200 [Craigia yunnanensis]